MAVIRGILSALFSTPFILILIFFIFLALGYKAMQPVMYRNYFKYKDYNLTTARAVSLSGTDRARRCLASLIADLER